jgi:hypothetical protein
VLLAASPSPGPEPAVPVVVTTATVICARTPFYQYPPGNTFPIKAPTAEARQGQRFEALRVSTTLESVQYVETNVVVVDFGYGPNAHYWLLRQCVYLSNQ